MKSNRYFAYLATFAALALTGFFIDSGPVVAQEVHGDQTGDAIEEVVKVEVQVERHRVKSKPGSFITTEIVELRKHVEFADLDLSKQADVKELERRIETTAKEACEELDEIKPFPAWTRVDVRRCVEEAIADTDAELETVVAAAG